MGITAPGLLRAVSRTAAATGQQASLRSRRPLIAIPDLLDPDAGLVTEFDGRAHRKRRQHRADNVREEALEALGLTVVRADSLDMLWHRDELDARLQQGHGRGLSRTGGWKGQECPARN
ncbi:MAG: DUF559 domain-containing protein [Nocardioidaceae bacterium]|nr:DUF559 domain-containing protein [Nocardioidaceae bacterium]